MQESSNVLLELAKGNLSARVNGDYKGDHAIIKNALNSSLETLNEYVGEISRVLSSMSSGDLTIEIKKAFNGVVDSCRCLYFDTGFGLEMDSKRRPNQVTLVLR
jgi:methyl-accepting chemotaxis protein